jgi:putative ATP-dependent endonuclease of the OLD family
MKISKLVIKNFKMFREEKEFDFSDMNFLIGENNTGKTTVMEAIDYLLNGAKKDVKYRNINIPESEYVSVEAEIEGDFSSVDTKYKDYIYAVNEKTFIKIKRSDEVKVIKHGGKDKGVDLNQSKILCYKESISDYENPTGKDTTFNIFDSVFIYAKQNINDVVSFDSSKILGKLVKAHSQDFFTSPPYQEFKDKHKEVFITGKNSLKNKFETLSNDLSDILKEQWGDVNFKFNFELLDHSNYLKNGNLLVSENGKEHELDYKGSGMQRSTMLALIQLISNISNKIGNSNMLLCIDEPELNLHPKAQEKLVKAFRKISENIQIIISTHSPYVLKNFNKDKDNIYVFKDKAKIDFEKMKEISILPFGPTLAEVEYFAYNLQPNDFHNELYGFLEGEKMIGNFINKKPIWKKIKKNGNIEDEIDVSLQYYIRNSIHHPENDKNDNFTEVEMQNSLKEMIEVVKKGK